MTEPRPFDLILLGATGFTGRLVAHELAREPGLVWALAGRNAGKLERLVAELAERNPGRGLEALPVLVADSHDAARLGELARQTRVVCTTVGPYDLLGEPLVAACAEAGTDYCDLTGETPFIRRMIDRYHGLALTRGARIVHGCGFDSIPSDLGVMALQEVAMARLGRPAERVRFTMKRAKGGFSGGTVASLLNVVEQVKDPAVRRIVGHPYALNPEGERRGPDRGDGVKPVRTSNGRWLGPFLMGPVNTRVVRRSHALLGYPYGPGFRYEELQDFGAGAAGLARASAMGVGLAGFFAVMSVPVGAKLVKRFLPKPGEGPSEELVRSGYFEAELTGWVGDEVVTLDVRGEGDPGYGATSKMLAQSALALAFDEAPAGTLPAGVLTPSTALGEALRTRLAKVGVTFALR